MDRRTLLAGLTGSMVAPRAARAGVPSEIGRAVRARGTGPDYTAAIDAVSAYARRELAFWDLPGMTLGLVDVDGFSAVLTFGNANVERGTPVTPAHLFQIGSISKSFTAATLLSLADEGRVDLDAPLARYLPDLPLPPEPITVAQVLNHTTGMPGDAPIFPRVPDGRLWCGYAPGTKFSYSNTGYVLLGLLIARLADAPHPEVIRRRILQPLGMTATRSTIIDRDRDRDRYATGYAPLVASRPFLPGAPLAPGPWVNMDAASGSIASTPDDMARWLRFLLGAARGEGLPILSAAAARRFTTPQIDAAAEFGPGARYAFGLATVPVGGKPCLHHTGGMLTFASSMHIDGGAGVACFASSNAQLGNGYRPRLVTAYAVELMRVARGGNLPAVPDVAQRVRVEGREALAGRYLAADGTAVELVTRGDAMALLSDGAEGRLIRAGGALVTDHPFFADAPLRVERVGGRPVGFWWGETLFARGRRAVQPAVPDRIRALTGWYQSDDPWVGGVALRARGDRLALESVTGTSSANHVLTEHGEYWTIGDADTVERLRFEVPVGGRPARLNSSGADLPRRSLP